ncbi:NACHT and WD domain protein [Xylariales sp. AK1849]|nr:NACHT and WD domain protein [Xylariales sp. AK1849]
MPIQTSTTQLVSDTSATYVELVSRNSGFLKKRFTNSWARKRTGGDDEEGARGLIGLRPLYHSPEPLIDLIFVHGLRGGSTKTWRKGNDPRNYWPQLWLPIEPGLHNANIHSFGYDSDWASTNHVYAVQLDLAHATQGPIILLGHSMGGLVIKKAFILARDVPDFQERIRCIFFLATPHRGSDYAAVLNNILTISGILSPRDYITDLTAGSTSAQLINEDFGRYANDLTIFSFYETLQMKLGISSSLVVEKSSAILVQYLNANHRDICKFESPDDPNYVTLRNAITSATQDILKDLFKSKGQESRDQMKALQTFLGISEQPEDQCPRVEGSCQWIDARDDFQEWRDPAGELIHDEIAVPGKNPSIFWVYANPGTGKTFLAAHIVDELRQFKLECACYFFHIGNKSSRSLGDFLRSIAHQMAMSNASVRKKLVELCQEGSAFDKDDAATIWNKIFRKGIFQYWVIDAIDECGKYQEFFTMVRGVQLSFPLRIFVTSRRIPDIQKLCRPLESSASITCMEILAEDSTCDIDCYIQDCVKNMTNDFVGGKEDMAGMLLRRSNACFLWVRLVMDELEKVYTSESITQILQNIPEGMIPYYERTIRTMTENKLEKHVAKAVLVWVVASSRNLLISELSNALSLDINTVLPSAKSAVEGLCGQLVLVDDAGLVGLVHPTVREFLLSEAAGEFSISKSNAHETIALTCLQLLSGGELRPPRTRRMLTQPPKKQQSSPLLDYAITQFSEHVYTASAETDQLVLALDHFFKTNVLSWIERIARKGDLHPLIRVSKNLKGYLDRRAKYRSPFSDHVKNINGWSIDLSRIATKFGTALLQNPSSIYFMIPPFCPSSSAIYQQFAKRPDPSGLSVVGHVENVWDDCISSVNFGEDSIASSVSCGENLIAVGMESGDINLFNRRSCQKEGMVQQKYPVDLVHIIDDKSIATCTTKSIVLMDREGKSLWETRLRFRCILLTSHAKVIIAVSQHGHVLQWDMSTGTLLEDQVFAYISPDEDDDDKPTVKAPDVASLSPDTKTLALGYRWGTYNRLAPVLLFNPNPNIGLLLVIYTDHDLSLYDTDTGALVKTHSTSSTAGILSASCSPDGRTLATVDKTGILQIWDFESLTLLYHVLTPSASFRILNFVSDGSGVADVVDGAMRIWVPSALVRKNIDEDESVSEYETLRSSKITALFAHPSQSVIFAGKHNGQVIAFDTKTGQRIGVLYSHSHGAFVTHLAVGKNDIIASGDVNCTVQVWNLKTGLSTPLIFNDSGDYLLVSTMQSDQLYYVRDGSCVGSLHFNAHERKIWRWLEVPSAGNHQLGLLQNHTLTMFSTQSFPFTVENSEVHIEYKVGQGSEETEIDSAVISPETQTLVLNVRYTTGYVSSSSMFLFDLSKLATCQTPNLYLTPLNDLLPKRSRHFIGLSERERSVLFLHQNSWLCSISLDDLAQGRYTQHFFVPNEYMSARQEVLPARTADNNVVFFNMGSLRSLKMDSISERRRPCSRR